VITSLVFILYSPPTFLHIPRDTAMLLRYFFAIQDVIMSDKALVPGDWTSDDSCLRPSPANRNEVAIRVISHDASKQRSSGTCQCLTILRNVYVNSV
jgi:hypothetical protein